MDIELSDEMRALERRFDDLFRAFMGPRSRLSFPAMPTVWRRPFVPAADLFERKGDLVIRLELPGIDPEKDIQITMSEGELIIKGERKQREEVKEQDYYRMEACYGAFERHFAIPHGMDDKKIKAEYVDGVLEVVLPAAAKVIQPPKAKGIPIKTVKQAA